MRMSILEKALSLDKSNKKVLMADAGISIAILSYFVILMIQYFVLYFFGLNETSMGVNIQITSKVIVGIAFLYVFPVVFKRRGVMFILIYSAAIAIFAFNYMFFELNRLHLSESAFKFFFISLPCFIYMCSLAELRIFESITKKASKIIYLFGITLGILVIAKKILIGSYSMTMSYYMLLPTITFLKEFFDKHSIKYLLLSIISAFIMLAIGSRGAIMCLGIYIILYQIINLKRGNSGKILTLLFAIIICIICSRNILVVLNSVLAKFDIYSRNISLFLRKGIYLSGREILYEEIIKQILLHPIVGIGIAGDRAYIGGYVHNIFLEILSGFGIIIGVVIITLLCCIIFASLLNKDKYNSNLVLIWLCVGFLPLIVSGSYLTSFPFWIFMGLAIKSISIKKI